VGNGTTTDVETKTGYIVVGAAQCTVPNVSDGTTTKSAATTAIQNAGFVANPIPSGGNQNWVVQQQSPQGGLVAACGSQVTIRKN